MTTNLTMRSCPKGVVLVAVLWIIVLLTLMVTVAKHSGMIDTRVSHMAAERMRCKWACRAGLQMAIGLLNDDELEGGADSLYDIWSPGIADTNSVPLDSCTFSIEVIDEAGKLNLNTATREQLLYIPDMTEDVADGIIDWRDSDDEISTVGAESGYYLNLRFAYRARNGNFKTVRELLLVRGVTPGLFFGDASSDENVTEYNMGWVNYFTCYSYDLNKDADGNDRINVNSANESQLTSELQLSQSYAQWIVQNRTFNGIGDLISNSSPAEPSSGNSNNQAQPLDLQTFYEIVDKITVSDGEAFAGKVNINTASKDVLTALLGGNEQVAYDIIAYRQTMETGLETLGELRNVDSLTPDIARTFLNSVTTKSSVYTVNSTGIADATGITRKLHAVVDRDKSPAAILYFRAGAVN